MLMKITNRFVYESCCKIYIKTIQDFFELYAKKEAEMFCTNKNAKKLLDWSTTFLLLGVYVQRIKLYGHVHFAHDLTFDVYQQLIKICNFNMRIVFK